MPEDAKVRVTDKKADPLSLNLGMINEEIGANAPLASRT